MYDFENFAVIGIHCRYQCYSNICHVSLKFEFIGLFILYVLKNFILEVINYIKWCRMFLFYIMFLY